MNDRELMELAAKACGLQDYAWCEPWKCMALIDWHGGFVSNKCWNPARSDGDCARMEAALGIDVEWLSYELCAYWKSGDGILLFQDARLYSDHKGDKQSARRMASLRVAAEIGKAIP